MSIATPPQLDAALEIAGHVDLSVGDIDTTGDVHVRGNVLEQFKVHSGGRIVVDGAVEAAELRAAADIEVAGSIVGKDRGSITAGGNVRARFITSAKIEAAGDIHCEIALANCTVVCGGRIVVEQGQIAGGKLITAGGVTCKSLGNSSGVMTVVEVGVDESLRRDLPGIIAAAEAQKAKAKKIEQTVQPLLQNQKKLTPAQKEKATELLFDAQSMNQLATETLLAVKERYENSLANCKPEVVLSDILNPGVVLRFPGLQTRVMSPFKGPLKIAIKRSGQENRILLIDTESGSSQQLGAESIPDQTAKLMGKVTFLLAQGR